MAQYFLDTSALAKRYLSETGSQWVQQLCVAESIAVSALVIVEISATLARRVREGSITAGERDGILRRFRRHLGQMTAIDVDLRILNAAGSIVVQSPSTIPLRSLDAIHIASVQSLTSPLTTRGLGPLTFVSADTRLLAAAQWAGFTTDNPEAHP